MAGEVIICEENGVHINISIVGCGLKIGR